MMDPSVGVATAQLPHLPQLVAQPLAHGVATRAAACGALFPAPLQAVVGEGRSRQHEEEGGHAHEGQRPCEEDEERHDPQDEQTDATAEVSCGVTLPGLACHVAGKLRILLVELALDLLEDLLFVFRKWHTVVAHPPGRASARPSQYFRSRAPGPTVLQS